MQINSVWHLTHSSRSLRINISGNDPKAAIIFTEPQKGENVKESTRIALEKTAKKIKLRKYLIISEETTISAGPFNISVRDIDKDGERCNILINDQLLFLTFVPESSYVLPENVTLLFPAQSFPDGYYLAEVLEYIERNSIKKAIVSGLYSKEWSKVFLALIECSIKDNVAQQGLFI